MSTHNLTVDNKEILPCPCCKGSNLTPNLWSLDTGEIDAIECDDCLCGAPLTAWQNRND